MVARHSSSSAHLCSSIGRGTRCCTFNMMCRLRVRTHPVVNLRHGVQGTRQVFCWSSRRWMEVSGSFEVGIGEAFTAPHSPWNACQQGGGKGRITGGGKRAEWMQEVARGQTATGCQEVDLAAHHNCTLQRAATGPASAPRVIHSLGLSSLSLFFCWSCLLMHGSILLPRLQLDLKPCQKLGPEG